jgi:hypothetical protein
MKRELQRCQAGLFDSDPRPLPILPSQQDELVDLLSQLLWQVVSARPMFERESDDEQDRA